MPNGEEKVFGTMGSFRGGSVLPGARSPVFSLGCLNLVCREKLQRGWEGGQDDLIFGC